MLESRQISSTLGGELLTITAVKGCPQGGVLSPLLWAIVIDELLYLLNSKKYHSIGYADDIVVIITDTDINIIRDLMQRAIRITLDWCNKHGLTVNPCKTVIVSFHRKHNLNIPPLHIQGTLLSYSSEVTYLGIKLDSILTWTPHLQNTILKATKTFWALRCLVGNTWGLNPSIKPER